MFRGKQSYDFKCFQVHADPNDKYVRFDCDLFKCFVFNYFGYVDEKAIRIILKSELIHYTYSNGLGRTW